MPIARSFRERERRDYIRRKDEMKSGDGPSGSAASKGSAVYDFKALEIASTGLDKLRHLHKLVSCSGCIFIYKFFHTVTAIT